MADVLITPADGKIEFKEASGGNLEATIATSDSNLTLTCDNGDIVIGDTTADVFIGDGVNPVDIVFERDGEVRATNNNVLTLGSDDSFVSANSLNFNVTSDGKMAIGATNTTAGALYVNGDVFSTGILIAASDLTLKTDVETLDNSLNLLDNVRGVRYRFKSETQKSIGVIAQEIKTSFPELVSGEEGSMGVNYDGLVGVLVQAVKELKTELDQVKKKLSEIENGRSD